MFVYRQKSILLSLLLQALLFMLFCISCSPISIHTQNQCETELAGARVKYREVSFVEAINSVNRCLSKGKLPKIEQKQAYELLGASYFGLDSLEQARTAIRSLLKLSPDHKPDSVQYDKHFVALVEEVKGEIKRPGKKWLWIGIVVGGGGLAAGLVTILGRDSNKPPPTPSLPFPSDLP